MAHDHDHHPDAQADHPVDVSALAGHAVIAGFGVPGRAVADLLHGQGMPYCVIEKNEQTVERCRKAGFLMVEGDAGEADVLRQAGVERAALFACAIPDDAAMYEAVAEARRMNPKLRIIARCRYVSSGIEATRRGADDVVVEEQAVAQSFESLLTADPHTAAPPRITPG